MNDENNAVFTDAKGNSWHIAITFGDIQRVKKHVKGADGKPLDLCYIAETGDFKQVTDHIEVICQCVYWLLKPSICEYTGLKGMEAMTDFYAGIDTNTIEGMTKAWFEALVNFTPFPVIKAAMIAAWEMTTREQVQAAIDLLAGQLQKYMNMRELSESTQKDILMEN